MPPFTEKIKDFTFYLFPPPNSCWRIWALNILTMHRVPQMQSHVAREQLITSVSLVGFEMSARTGIQMRSTC